MTEKPFQRPSPWMLLSISLLAIMVSGAVFILASLDKPSRTEVEKMIKDKVDYPWPNEKGEVLLKIAHLGQLVEQNRDAVKSLVKAVGVIEVEQRVLISRVNELLER